MAIENKMDIPKFYNMNSYHHLYNRGVNKDTIFFEDKDYKYFLRKAKEYKAKILNHNYLLLSFAKPLSFVCKAVNQRIHL